MNRVAGHPDTKGPKSRKLWLLYSILVAFVIVLAIWPSNEPAFKGRTASEWFKEGLSAGSPKENVKQAFVEMDSDAVPFLIAHVAHRSTAGQSLYKRIYQLARRSLPRMISKSLPEPSDPDIARLLAIVLLGDIVEAQKWKALSEGLTPKPSSPLAIPVLIDVLRETNDILQLFAAQSLGQSGPQAAQAIPDLIRIAEGCSIRNLATYVQSIGQIGSAASNAVPLLLSILNNTNHSETLRECVIMALGSIGPPAGSAAPAIVPFLLLKDHSPAFNATRSLANIGVTPEEIVPLLEAMTKDPKNPDTLAAVALWNRDHNTAKLCKCLADALNGGRQNMVLYALDILGTNAIPCALKIEDLINDSDPNISRQAKLVLRKMKPAGP